MERTKIAMERNMSALMRNWIDAICIDVKLLGEYIRSLSIVFQVSWLSDFLFSVSL